MTVVQFTTYSGLGATVFRGTASLPPIVVGDDENAPYETEDAGELEALRSSPEIQEIIPDPEP